VLNERSVQTLDNVKIEPEIKKAQPGERFQFMRQGYYALDAADSADGALVFNKIVALKDSYRP
jgi:glutaminyl-tRNA synthetase